MKILVVDDEVRIREVVSEYAKVSGLNVTRHLTDFRRSKWF